MWELKGGEIGWVLFLKTPFLAFSRSLIGAPFKNFWKTLFLGGHIKERGRGDLGGKRMRLVFLGL